MPKSSLSRTICLFIIIFLVSDILVSCSPATKSSNITSISSTALNPNNSNNTTDRVNIRLLTRYAEWDSLAPILIDLQKQFMKDHKDVFFQNDSIQEEASYNSKLRSDIATGNVPDVFQMYGSANLVPFAKNGMLMDITPLLDDKNWADGFADGAFDSWNFEKYGQKGIYGIPTLFSPEMFYYNTELFKKAGITKVPDTMDELFEVIRKLKNAGIVPWGVGAKDAWRVGHIHNNIVYKECGVNKLIDIGARKAKWTDPDVIESLKVLKDLNGMNAFDDHFEDIDWETEKNNFFNEKYAMTLNGSWFLSDVLNSKINGKVKLFPFPYFKDKLQFKDNGVIFGNAIFLNGKLKGRERELTIEFAKLLTGTEATRTIIRKVQRTCARKDINIDDFDLDQRFKYMISYMKSVKVPGGDYFDYDPLNSMADRSRNSIISMLVSKSPEETAKEIQNEIDNKSKDIN